MANKKKKPTQGKSNTKKPLKNTTANQPRDPREASPKEILFFKIGMSIIGLAVITIAIIFIVQYYVNREAEDPYQDYVVITVDELLLLTKDFDGTYGDPDTLRQDEYEHINTLYQSNENFYVFFYHSGTLNDEITAAIEDNTGANNIPTVALLEDEPDNSYRAIYFLDLDDATNASLFDNANLSHLGLDAEAENMLLTYEYDENAFDLTIDINEILQIISDLQS